MEEMMIDLVETQIIVRDAIRVIIRGGSEIVAEKHILSQMPQVGYEWFQEQVVVVYQKEYIENDDSEDNILEDEEPEPVNIEHWRRYQGQVGLAKSPEQSPIRRSDTKRYTKISMGITQKNSECYDVQVMKMGELDEDLEFDPNIESMRQAKIRQVMIQQQKQQNDKIKNQEVQEQARQLKRLNVDAKSKYTYDFEGKVLVQKPPDMERYPKSYQNIQEKRSLVEVRDLMPNHKLQSELIAGAKKQSANLGQLNQFAIKTYVPQIDIIVMKEGVSFYDGKSEKRKDRIQQLMDIKDQNELQQTLLNTNVHMTKQEYQKITNTQQQQNNFQNKTLQLSVSQPQLQISKTSRTFQEDQINNDSLISYRQPKTTVNQSISSNILQKLNGSISILSEQQLIEDLIVLPPTKIKDHPLFGRKQTSEIPKQLPVAPITIELPQIPPNILSNTISKLPKSFNCPGTFPKLLPKHPRDRISKQVFNIKIDS